LTGFLGGARLLGRMIHVGVDHADLLWRTPSLSGELIRCQSNRGIYVCSRGGVTISGVDGTDTSSRVSIASCMWEPVVASCLV
jgi:hypothetical protein